MRVVVFDDDPTGTQSATGVDVLFDTRREAVVSAVRGARSVYVQTNSRALESSAAVALVTELRDAVRAAAESVGEPAMIVLRGDSTLRGHVFAELDAVADPDAVVVFAPAFPAGGRVTVGGVHWVELAGERIPAARSEYARDPVFPFRSSELVEYVAEKSERTAISVPLAEVRAGGVGAALHAAAPGSVVIPDIETDDDVRHVAHAIRAALDAGVEVAVRCAAPLAAELAGVASERLLAEPVDPSAPATLVVCGSHTAGATAQVERLAAEGVAVVILSTDELFADPDRAVAAAVCDALPALSEEGIVALATERHRSEAHGTVEDGARVMSALMGAVRQLVPHVGLVVSKGGITASDVASVAIGASSARVEGQILPGVSVLRLAARDGRELRQVVVPGNVGGPDVLVAAVKKSRGVVAVRGARR